MTETPFISLALGAYLELRAPEYPTADIEPGDGLQVYRFQNFFLGKNCPYQGDTYSFVPFGFSGVTISRQGDNVDAELVFGNNELARSFADRSISQRWMAKVYVVQINNIDDPNTEPAMLHSYVGQVTAGGWKDAEIMLRLNSVLDAVGNDVPGRTLHQQIVGALPMQGNVSLR